MIESQAKILLWLLALFVLAVLVGVLLSVAFFRSTQRKLVAELEVERRHRRSSEHDAEQYRAQTIAQESQLAESQAVVLQLRSELADRRPEALGSVANSDVANGQLNQAAVLSKNLSSVAADIAQYAEQARVLHDKSLSLQAEIAVLQRAIDATTGPNER